MDFLSPVENCLSRALCRKKTLVALGIFYLIMLILGICFFRTPAFYVYHINACDRYLTRVCYSDRNVFLIFLERTAGCAVLVVLISLAGVHFAGLILPPVVLVYRAYTFGGCTAILFSVYKFSGAMIALVLYLPIRLLTDAVLLLAAALSFARAGCFCFTKRDFFALAGDALILTLFCAIICLLEMLLLLALFHPIGSLI